MRRRPAAREAGRPEAGAEVDGEVLRLATTGARLGASFEGGERVRCEEVPLEVFRRGLPVCVEGIYWGGQVHGGRLGGQPLHQDAQRCGVGDQGAGHERGVAAEVGYRPQGAETQASPLWRQVPREARGRGSGPCDVDPKEGWRGRSMDGQLDRGGPRARSSTSGATPSRGERRGREQRKWCKEVRARGEGREEKEEEEEERSSRRKSRERPREGRSERRSSKRTEGGLWRDRVRPRSSLPSPVRHQGPEEDQKEEEGLLFIGEFGERRKQHFGFRGGLRGSAKGSSTLPKGAGRPSGSSNAGNAEQLAHGNRWDMAARSGGNTTSGMSVLQAIAGRARSRRTDPLLGHRPSLTRSDGRMCRRLGPEVEVGRDGLAGIGVANRAAARGITTRMTPHLLKRGNKRGNQRTKGGTKNSQRSIRGQKQVGQLAVARLWQRRKRKRRERKGQAPEQGQRRAEEVREEVLPWLGTGGCPPSDYDAPFEAEGNGFPAALNPCRHVDEAGVERQQGVWLGSPAVPSRLIVDETSLMTSSAEKVCMRPPVAGDSLIQVVPWLVHELVLLGPKVGLDKQCKTQPKGDVFPLPTNMLHLRDIMGVDLGIVGMVRGMCLALNLFYGVPAENDFHPTSLQVEAVRHLAREAQVASEWPERLEQISWQEFFHLKTIDYCGDEVLCAQSTTWANLAPAMPAEIASVALADVCELGCKHYVENFSEYLLPGEMQQAMKGPRVLVHDDHWREVCEGLTRNGVCTILPKSQVYHVQGQPLLNGLFGVKKDEIVDGLPVHRLIMDLRPCNNVCRGLEGDVATLPSWATMGPLQLMPTEDLVVSSEDVRCFFYIFKVPQEWHPFLAFNKPLPRDMWPGDDGPYYIASQVLPMGFKNSVSLAQHVHRNIVRMASTRTDEGLRPEQEVRKDRPFSASSVLHRIYLDNFDQLEKVPKNSHELLVGECSPGIMALRAEYESWGVPRHPKKAVSRSLVAEVQGAIIDGNLGIAYAKPSKVYKYTGLSILFLKETMSSQKQVQVIAGGLVYLSMFRRPLLGSLNNIWRFIEAFRGYPPVVKLPIPDGVKLEVARFLCLIPLARLDFRLSVSSEVTASDASTSGGGLTVSTGLTGFGIAASQTVTRGDVAEPGDLHGVLTVGLFDGIGALRVAADACGLAVVGHISVEVNKAASRVLESRFPATVFVEGGVEAVTEEEVQRWACQFSQASLVLIGAGPPCQGVSGLNADRRGALRDHRQAPCSFTSSASPGAG